MSGSAAQNGYQPVALRPLVFNSSFNPDATYWTAYTIRADTAGPYDISLTYLGNESGELTVVLDGNALPPVAIQNTGGSDQTVGPLSVTLGSGLHSIRSQSQRGQFNVRTITLAAGAPPTPTPVPVSPTPAPLPVEATPVPAPPPPSVEASAPAPDMMPDSSELYQ